MVESGQHRIHPAVRDTAFQSQRPLTDGGETYFGIQIFRDPVLPSHPTHPGRRQHDGIQPFLSQFFDPCVKITPEGNHLKIRSPMLDLGLAAEAAGADPCAAGQVQQVFSVPADHDIPRVFATGDRGQMEPFRKSGGHVFHAVNGQADLLPKKRLLDLLHEQTFSTHLGQRDVRDFVAGGLDLF